jgi:L,D-transpeptidase catalytic domain/Putative peptidoglycan binding domain
MRSRRATNFVLALLLACAGLFASFAVVATAPAQTADTTGTGTTTEPTVTTPYVIPDGVTIGGVAVAGMNIPMARATVESFFETSLPLRIGKVQIRLKPDAVGANADIESSLLLAEAAQPGDTIPLDISVDPGLLHKYVDSLAKRFDHPAVNARVFLRRMRPRITDGKQGQQLRKTAAVNGIKNAFKADHRFALSLPLKVIATHVTKANFGPIIVIRRGSNRLYLYKSARFWRRFGVATGQAVYPTPLGRFEIVVKNRNPWWYPPNSPWAKGEKPVPPGPGNPLGTRWMGLSASGVGIHGTPNSSSIGYSLSHGCIRMYIPDAEWLFEHVNVGTPVFIIPQ